MLPTPYCKWDSCTAVAVLQYLELGFTFYENYVAYAAILLVITLASGVLATYGLYDKRMALYNSVQQRHLVPVVIAGFVRSKHHMPCLPYCMRHRVGCEVDLVCFPCS